MDKNDQLETATVLGAREGREAECLLSACCCRAWFVRLVVNVTAQFTHRAPCAWFSYLSSTSWDPVPRASRCLLGLRSFSLSLNSIDAAQCQCRVPARRRWSRMSASHRQHLSSNLILMLSRSRLIVNVHFGKRFDLFLAIIAIPLIALQALAQSSCGIALHQPNSNADSQRMIRR